MGLNLTLLPFYSLGMDNECFSLSVLNLERRSELWRPILEIEKEKGVDIPDNFSSYLSRDGECEDTHWGKTINTPYDERVRYVFAKHLKPLVSHPGVQDNYKNRAVWAYLEQCPDDLKIALFWD